MSALAEQPLHSRAFPPNGNSNTSNGNGNGSTGTGTGTGTGGHARPHTHATHASVPSSDGGDGYGDPSTGEGDEREDGDGGNESSDSELAATQDGQATKAKRKRKNVSRACDRCRERKIKCSGACDPAAAAAVHVCDASGVCAMRRCVMHTSHLNSSGRRLWELGEELWGRWGWRWGLGLRAEARHDMAGLGSVSGGVNRVLRADRHAGDEPTCKGCDKSKKQCVYRAHVDGRMT